MNHCNNSRLKQQIKNNFSLKINVWSVNLADFQIFGGVIPTTIQKCKKTVILT